MSGKMTFLSELPVDVIVVMATSFSQSMHLEYEETMPRCTRSVVISEQALSEEKKRA